jgi:hypothetical protein
MTVKAAPARVDLLVINGTLLVDSASPPLGGGAVAVRDGHIVGVDRTSTILSRFRAETVVDAAGGLVHPGFPPAAGRRVWAAVGLPGLGARSDELLTKAHKLATSSDPGRSWST